MVEPFYAFKCNPDPVVARLLATLGCGFDCATMGELKTVLHEIGPELSFGPRGLAADKMIYANPAKMLSHLEYAAQHGVTHTTFDGIDELYKLAKVNNSLPQTQKLKLVLRLATDDKESVCSFSNKFGCPVADAPALLDLAKELDLDVVGVSFHVGSGCGNTNAYTTAFKHAARVFQYADEIGMAPMTMVDIGGGFPGDKGGYGGSNMPTFQEIAQAVRSAIAEFRVNVNADS